VPGQAPDQQIDFAIDGTAVRAENELRGQGRREGPCAAPLKPALCAELAQFDPRSRRSPGGDPAVRLPF